MLEFRKLDNGFNHLELFILSSSWVPLNLIGSAKIEWLKLSSAWRVWNAFSDFLNYYNHCRYIQLHWSATELKLLGAQPNFWVHRAPVHPLISSPGDSDSLFPISCICVCLLPPSPSLVTSSQNLILNCQNVCTQEASCDNVITLRHPLTWNLPLLVSFVPSRNIIM